MRKVSIIVAAALAVLTIAILVLDIVLPAYTGILHAVTLPLIAALAVFLLIAILLDRGRRAAVPAAAAAEIAATLAPPARLAPSAAPPPDNRHAAEVVSFLALLQEKGRLVDFLMDDITGYSDAQVGAAARVVHEGCKAALAEHLVVEPIRSESEGDKVVVPTGYAADDYRLVGKITGQAPFTGTLVHHGWRVERVALPRLIRTTDRLPTIAPAEVELS
ncbi:DUF2760 domain-containing protein [Rhodoplanes azumiensis]|uniref:DUF2760 domain-containing protein n=1 Tax=Rhodoplanes azumiensis TaxID=1897628 RepID=A0ABW5AF18_9BRAD